MPDAFYIVLGFVLVFLVCVVISYHFDLQHYKELYQDYSDALRKERSENAARLEAVKHELTRSYPS